MAPDSAPAGDAVNVGAVLYVLGRLCTLLAVLLAVPLLLCLNEGTLGTEVADAFIVSAAVSLGLGWALQLSFEFDAQHFGFGEAFATVTLSWVLFTGLGALPFLITAEIPGVIDACFETLSGFTTTGCSILVAPEEMSHPLLFWRAMTHWIGGMGIVALSVAILPALGAGGNFLFQAEMPGPENEKLLPRISSTAKLLWGVYVGLTVSEFLLLWLAGMTPFDSICHTFATVATGGFGTRADSLASFSPAIQWIVTGFMFLAGLNFVMLLSAARGRPLVALRNTEVRVYMALILLATTIFAVVLFVTRGLPDGGVEELVRDTTFTTVSLATSTGFVTADFEVWPPLLHLVILSLMFVGACAGSTGGGSKVIRFIVAGKAGVREVRRLLRPSAVFVVKVGGRPVSEDVVQKTIGYYVIYMGSLVIGTAILMALSLSMGTSFSAVLSCLSNIGPGLDAVGPTHNFAAIPDLGKLLLMFCMLLGRLEFYSVLVLFLPLAWRR